MSEAIYISVLEKVVCVPPKWGFLEMSALWKNNDINKNRSV